MPCPAPTRMLRRVAPLLIAIVASPALAQTDGPAESDSPREVESSREADSSREAEWSRKLRVSRPTPIAAPRPAVRLRTEAAPPGTIWVDGQDAAESTAKRHGWYSDVRAEELTGGDWLSHFAGEPAEARYELTVPDAGEYHFWVRANPVGSPKTEYRIGEDDWKTIDFSDPVQRVNVATDGTPDLRFIAWVDVGKVELEAGPLSVRFRFSSKNNHHGAIDAFVFSRSPFTPNYALRPGEKTGRADAGRWAFEPSPDTFEADALLDLRFLNDTPAGKHGFIRPSGDGESFVDGRGEPIRFWSGTTYVAGKVVRSVTDEITLDHRRGILTVDTPRAQAVAGFLGESDPIRLSDVVIRSGNEYAAVHLVSLDTKPIRDSGNLLIQVGTTARPYGFREQPTHWADDETSDGATEESSTADEETTDAMKITSLGTSPWNLDTNDVEILVRGDGVSEAFVLDANGYPTRRWELDRRGEYWYFRFPPDALYVVLR